MTTTNDQAQAANDTQSAASDSDASSSSAGDAAPTAPADSGDSDDARADVDAGEDVPSEEALLAAARDEAAELKDKWIRALADLDNFRKRSRREQDEAVARAVASVVDGFLPVFDNLDRALNAASDEPTQIVAGVRMVRQAFLSALARHGIEPIDSVGKPFDPAVHEALAQQDLPDLAPGTVAVEFEKGFVRGDRLVRPARVIVAGPGSGTVRAESGQSSAADGGASPT